MPQDAGHAFCRCAMTAPINLFCIIIITFLGAIYITRIIIIIMMSLKRHDITASVHPIGRFSSLQTYFGLTNPENYSENSRHFSLTKTIYL